MATEREYEDLFSNPAWQELMRDAEEAIEARKERLLQAGTIDHVRFIQGEVAQLRILSTMQALLEANRVKPDDDEEIELELIG